MLNRFLECKLGSFMDLEVALETLRSNFSFQLGSISDVLKSIYLEDRKDQFKRRAFQLSQLGIFWSEIVSLGLELELEEAPIMVADMDHWNRMETSTKELIVQWLKDFRKSPNLWGFDIRRIMLSIEENCNSSHSRESVLQCFGEYNIGNITAMGTKFYTDFVRAGRNGWRGAIRPLIPVRTIPELLNTISQTENTFTTNHFLEMENRIDRTRELLQRNRNHWTGEIKFMLWNATGMMPSLDRIVKRMQEEEILFCFVTETWLNPKYALPVRISDSNG